MANNAYTQCASMVQSPVGFLSIRNTFIGKENPIGHPPIVPNPQLLTKTSLKPVAHAVQPIS